jgi:uncharacterized membrane-anchored protein YjiN (DUF445 family)
VDQVEKRGASGSSALSAPAAEPLERAPAEAAGGSGMPGPPGAPPGMQYTESDAVKRRGVRKMKTVAVGFLLAATVVYALTTWGLRTGGGWWSWDWAGYVQAAAEAGMVGGLADWFAVTALFKHPLGLPIPHTAIIPTKKDVFGRSLGEFVGENFLAVPVVRARIGNLSVARRAGEWLAAPGSAERVTKELSAALRGALRVLRDEDVQAVVGEAVTRRAEATQIAQPIGQMLARVFADGGHRGVVDMVVNRLHDWLVTHEDRIVATVSQGAPGWTPRFIDRTVGTRVYRELLRFTTEMRDDPEHAARGALDEFLADFAKELQTDPDTIARVERAKNDLLNRPEVQNLIASAWSAVRAMVLEAAEDPDSELRRRATSAIRSFGRRLATDERMQAKADKWLGDAAEYVVTTYRADITSLISETVAGWDADEASAKIEANVGRDLQFIRINGTVVGAFAGLLIHTASTWL